MLKSFLLLSLVISIAYGGTLYSMVTEFSGSKTETVVWVVSVDMKTGAVKNNTEAFVYAGSSATIDGISAFDQTNGIYYMATDYITPFIYSVDVKSKSLLPILTVFAESVEELHWNPTTGNLLTLSVFKNGIFLLNIENQRVNPILEIPSIYNPGFVMTGALDNKNQIYYLAGKIGKTNAATYGIAAINLATGTIGHQVAINASSCTIFPQKLYYQESTGSIVGAAEAFENNELYYYYVAINPTTGSCSKTQLQIVKGVVTCWTFDSDSNTLVFNEATSTGGYLHFFDITSGKQLPPVLVKQEQLPASLEYSSHF